MKENKKYIHYSDQELFSFWEDPYTKEDVSWVKLIREFARRGYVFTDKWTKKHHCEVMSLLS